MKYINKLKEMFQEMVLKKNPSLIPDYYHKDFLLYTNDPDWTKLEAFKNS